MNDAVRSPPLRRSLMVAVVGILAVALLLDRIYEYAVVFPRQIERQYEEHLRSQSHALGHDFSAMLQSSGIESLRLAVSARAANPMIMRLLVTDEAGKVMASIQPGDEGQHIGAVLPAFNLLDFGEAGGRNRIVVRLGADRMSVLGYAPVPMPREADELRATRRGVLFMEFDLRPIRNSSWSNLLSVESLLRWTTACVLAGVLIHFLLRWQLFRPLGHLQSVAARFGGGDGEARSRLEGKGELATLGTVFNEMHDRIQADRGRHAAREELYRSITDNGHSLIWLSGPDGSMRYFNKPWLEFSGRKLSEEAGSGWTANLHPEDAAPCRDAFEQATSDRSFLSLLCRLRRHDGAFRWILFEGTPRFGPEGEFLGHVGHCLDITDRKQAEEELQDERERLEITVTHRTRELVQARDAAQAANRAKTIFLANTSHEMRTPLNTIIGTSELVREKLTDEQQRMQLARVIQASRHLLGIIDDVVDMARLETAQLRLRLDRLVLGEVISEVTGMVAADLSAKGLELHVAIDEALLARPFTGDARRLAQVALEILGNAIKFTDRGSITLRARVAQESPATALLRFEVEDTGIGIAQEDMARLFAVFEQGDGSTTRRHNGMGLGLALAKRLVELMGGDMGVTSTPHTGSEFWFTVELRTGSTSDARANAEPAEAATTPPETHPPARGDASFDEVCDELARLIGQWSFEATALLSRHSVLLMDGLGPHYDGIAAAIGDFDFAAAREKLAIARQGIGTSGN